MMRKILICLFVAGATSCSTTSTFNGANVSYSETARQNFEMGEKALKALNSGEALAYFDYVRNKYPYTKYAADSDLRIADAYFQEDNWLEAADAYDFFIRFHPVHESLAYANFRLAKSNVNAIPSNFFIFPPSYTKDQTATKEALAALDRFIERFPSDENVKEAKEMRVKLREQTALQHMYVAQYNAKLRKWRGAAQRYDEVAKNFADTPSAKAAMLELAYIKKDRLDQKDEAKEILEKLEKDFPGTPEASTAASLLKSMSETASN
jgi:outer membrane protein assembly factor BamD